jgi:8-oxo-dGTP diphosphatase
MNQVAVGIIMKEGQVLACQRKRTARYPLKWEFPGGKVEASETPEAALVRELYEELSIRTTAAREFHRQDWVYGDGSFRVFYFLGEPANRAFEQISWVTPRKLLTMDILDGNRDAIELLVRHGTDRDTT